MDTLGYEFANEERLPILLSGVGGVKLLGVPSLQPNTVILMGPKIADAAMELLELWSCKNRVRAMVFDTTSVNTGARTAACISIQNSLNRELLWLACRHHVGERILVHTWDSLKIEASKSPDIMIFNRFKENFEKLTYGNLDNMQIPEIPVHLIGLKDSIVNLCREAYKADFARGDYKELIQLTLVYLNAAPEGFKRLQRPGALHKARWMSKLLYSLKIVLISDQILDLPSGTVLGVGQFPKLQQFVEFVVFCYTPWWISTPVSSAAPINDLKLIQSIQKYKHHHPGIGNAALKAIGLHMWYLTEELVPLSLFSHSLSDEEKDLVSKKILQSQSSDSCVQRTGSNFGKPIFPDVPQVTCDLSEFAGKDSWAFFRILDISPNFLNTPAASWPSNEEYAVGKVVVANLCVVNDAAEKGVKLCHDFLGSSRRESNLQNVLQVVENCRGQLPNQRKRKLESKRWFLKIE